MYSITRDSSVSNLDYGLHDLGIGVWFLSGAESLFGQPTSLGAHQPPTQYLQVDISPHVAVG
jgi:hypothetical protein